MRSASSEHGQAAVELVAVVPAIVVVVALAWQMALAGHAASAAASAARAAARAHAVGGDAEEAANRMLPARLEHGARIAERRDGTVRVRVPIPAVLVGGDLAHLSARASFDGGGH